MAAPSWIPETKAKAKAEGLVLFQVFIQGKHVGRGSYGVSGACSQRAAMILVAITDTSGLRSDEDRKQLETLMGIKGPE